jgi:hypothetical protein
MRSVADTLRSLADRMDRHQATGSQSAAGSQSEAGNDAKSGPKGPQS